MNIVVSASTWTRQQGLRGIRRTYGEELLEKVSALSGQAGVEERNNLGPGQARGLAMLSVGGAVRHVGRQAMMTVEYRARR